MKKNIAYCVLVLFLSMIIFYCKEYMKEMTPVAKVGNFKILEREVNCELEEKYRDMVIQNLVNNALIEQAYLDGKYNYTKEDLQNNLIDLDYSRFCRESG